MNRSPADGLVYYTFESLPRGGELLQAVTTRHGGVSTGPYASLNLSWARGDDPASVEENMQRVCRTLGVRRADVASPNQRHTANVRVVNLGDRGQVFPGYDALITDSAGVPLLLRFADCAPVLLYDPVHRAIGLVHSGWRGTVQGAPAAAVAAMASAFGSRPEDISAAIGPSIGPCCYEVGDDVVAAVNEAFDPPAGLLSLKGSGRHHFNLWDANRRLLASAGVRRIELGEVCTACHTADFYSHRAEGGKTGLFGVVMMLPVED